MCRSFEIEVINPCECVAYDEWVSGSPLCSIFHSSGWASLLAESYGFHPRYFVLRRNGEIEGCLPLMEVNSLLTGKRGVCLSFSDYCEVMVDGREGFDALLQAALEYGRRQKWRYLEFRGERFLSEERASREFAHHALELRDDPDWMLSKLRKSTVRSIHKAMREGVRIEFRRDLAGVLSFFSLHCLTRKRQGLPPQPKEYFVNLHKHLIERGLGFTGLAYHGGETIAGAICLHFGDNAIYKYGASNERYQHLRANNLLFWEMITLCAGSGFKTLSLGRTDLANDGLLHFKDGWGGVRTSLKYYRYDFREGMFDDGNRPGWDYSAILRKLPVRILRALGRLGYRHMG